jgi:hypothetical protein
VAANGPACAGDKSQALEFLHISELRIGLQKTFFAVFGSTNRLSCASPGLSVQGQTRVNAPVFKFRALALVAGRPIPFAEMPMTTQTAPVSRPSALLRKNIHDKLSHAIGLEKRAASDCRRGHEERTG